MARGLLCSCVDRENHKAVRLAGRPVRYSPISGHALGTGSSADAAGAADLRAKRPVSALGCALRIRAGGGVRAAPCPRRRSDCGARWVVMGCAGGQAPPSRAAARAISSGRACAARCCSSAALRSCSWTSSDMWFHPFSVWGRPGDLSGTASTPPAMGCPAGCVVLARIWVRARYDRGLRALVEAQDVTSGQGASSPVSSGRLPRATFESFPSLIRWICPFFSSLFSTLAKVDSGTPLAVASWPRST